MKPKMRFSVVALRKFLGKATRPCAVSVASLTVTSFVGAGCVLCSASASEVSTRANSDDIPELPNPAVIGRYVPSREGMHLDGRLSPIFDDESVSRTIFSHITSEYDALGQIEVNEVDVTVRPNVFSQIGVIDKEGVRAMCRMILSERPFAEGDSPIVFCDIGSGVGNVLLQVLAEVRQCSRVVGVEVIPSRHQHAVKAYENAKSYFPKWFASTETEVEVAKKTTTKVLNPSRSHEYTESKVERETQVFRTEKDAVFHLTDLVSAAPLLKADGVNVIFSHSWMFDDDLMAKFADVVAQSGRQMRMVFTSRPFKSLTGEELLPSEWTCAGLTTMSSDWNPESPFYVYVRS